MKKALDILNELDNKDIWVLLELGLEHTNISGAIAELQEAMKPKTCEGCKHRSHLDESLTNKTTNGFCVENGFFTRHGFCCNRHEPKEK